LIHSTLPAEPYWEPPTSRRFSFIFAAIGLYFGGKYIAKLWAEKKEIRQNDFTAGMEAKEQAAMIAGHSDIEFAKLQAAARGVLW